MSISRHGHRGRRGGDRSPTYNSWRAMIERCTYPAHPRYADYGGRGIRVSTRWRGPNGFVNFLADLGERPEGMTLDRENVDGHYEPGNCRWATLLTQRWNRRDMAAAQHAPDPEYAVAAPAAPANPDMPF